MHCRVCGSALHPDVLIAMDIVRGIDPGMPMPVVMKCRNGHTERLALGTLPEDYTPATARVTPRCAVCGVEIPRLPGQPPRKSCSPPHRRFIETKRAEALKLHRRDPAFRFVLEAQPWYQGAVTAFLTRARAVVVDAPLFPEIPAVWLEGFRRLYPALQEPGPPLPRVFPELEATDGGGAMLGKTRRYRRRKARVELAPEQLMPYPVPHA